MFEETLYFLNAKMDFNYLHDLHQKSNRFWIISSENAASSSNLVFTACYWAAYLLGYGGIPATNLTLHLIHKVLFS